MTDAAIPVTERAVEQFAEAYLSSLGADISKDGRRWSVSLPDDAVTDLDVDGATLMVASDSNEVPDDVHALASESELVQLMLEDASERHLTGALELTGESLGIQSPPWIANSPVNVVDESFSPYYDRSGLCTLCHVGIETVSEFQREELCAVAIDLNDCKPRPRLADTYLELTDTGHYSVSTGDVQADQNTIERGLTAARDRVENTIEDIVRDVREKATRAAEVELSEYEQYMRQRLDELDDELTALNDRIDAVSENIDTAGNQQERVKALRERKELRAERDELEAERYEVADKIDAGFREKRREIQDRHSLTVRVRPVAMTVVSYERGELQFTIETESGTRLLTYDYAAGIGVLDEETCDRCGHRLTQENPLHNAGGNILGACCAQ